MFDSHHPLDMLLMQPKQQQHRVSLLMYSRGKLVGSVVVLMGDIHFGKLSTQGFSIVESVRNRIMSIVR